jgi:peptidoglycan/xylan/chitin deacetylase (PgdA/CDA1 family)
MIKTFNFHDVRDNKNPKFQSRYELRSFLTNEEFKENLNQILRKFSIIKTRDLAEIESIPMRPHAILTFDDGLSDHYWIAKLLYEQKLTGTFLIPVCAVQNRKMIHSHKIQFILSCCDEVKLINMIMDELDESDGSKEMIWNKYNIPNVKNNWWTKEMVFATNFFRNHKKGKVIVDKFFAEHVSNDEEDFCSDFYLTESQISEMIDMGMEIGGHGFLSEALPNINQEDDIRKSLEFINKFDNNDLIFSYPNGKYDRATIEFLKKFDCKYAFTTIEGSIGVDTNLLEIPRYDGPQRKCL